MRSETERNKMTKEKTYLLTLQKVIIWLDANGESNSKIRGVVDMVLNHDDEWTFCNGCNDYFLNDEKCECEE